LIKPVARLPHQIFIDYNEGWMAYFSQYAIDQKPLYQPLNSFILNNYPPLSFYICGAAGVLSGDIITAGRWIALFGLLLTAAMICLIIFRFSGSAYLSIIGGILFVGYMCVHHGNYVGMSDPQWIAHGLMMSGFALFLYKKENKALFFCSMLIMLLAGLTKHNLIAVPVAITLWLFMYDRRLFYQWIVSGFMLVTISLLIMYVAYGENFFADILMAPRTYRVGRIAKIGNWLMPSIIYISMALALYTMFFKDRDVQLILLFSGISLVWGAFATGGGGVYYNTIFDFIISLFIAAFILAGRLPGFFKGKMNWGRDSTILAVIFLLLPVLLAIPYELYFTKEFLKNRPGIEKQIKEDIAFVAKFPEPLMCENLALSYWAGKKFSFDFFTTGEKLKTGSMPEEKIINKLDNKEFSLIQLNDQKGTTYHLPDEVTKQIFENYAVIRQSKASGIFLIRRSNQE